MKLAHAQIRKESGHSESSARKLAEATVLAAGLMLLPACASSSKAPVAAPSAAPTQPGPVSQDKIVIYSAIAPAIHRAIRPAAPLRAVSADPTSEAIGNTELEKVSPSQIDSSQDTCSCWSVPKKGEGAVYSISNSVSSGNEYALTVIVGKALLSKGDLLLRFEDATNKAVGYVSVAGINNRGILILEQKEIAMSKQVCALQEVQYGKSAFLPGVSGSVRVEKGPRSGTAYIQFEDSKPSI